MILEIIKIILISIFDCTDLQIFNVLFFLLNTASEKIFLLNHIAPQKITPDKRGYGVVAHERVDGHTEDLRDGAQVPQARLPVLHLPRQLLS